MEIAWGLFGSSQDALCRLFRDQQNGSLRVSDSFADTGIQVGQVLVVEGVPYACDLPDRLENVHVYLQDQNEGNRFLPLDLDAGLHTPLVQSAIGSLGTRLNSRVLLVTTVIPSLSACAAMSMSSEPMGVPFFFRKALILPYSRAHPESKAKTGRVRKKRSRTAWFFVD